MPALCSFSEKVGPWVKPEDDDCFCKDEVRFVVDDVWFYK